MKTVIIVDTNVVFSALLNPHRRIGEFILSEGQGRAAFVAPSYLRIEIDRHFDRLVAIAQSTPEKMRESRYQIFRHIHFVDDAQIPFAHFRAALPLVRNIDMNDIAFIALSEYLDTLIWSGDRELITQLRKKGFRRIMNFEEVQQLLRSAS